MIDYQTINTTILSNIRANSTVFSNIVAYPDPILWQMFVDVYNVLIQQLGYGSDGLLNTYRLEKVDLDTKACYISMDISLHYKPINQLLNVKIVTINSDGTRSEALIVGFNNYIDDDIFYFRHEQCPDSCIRKYIVFEYMGGYMEIPTDLLLVINKLMEESLCLPKNCTSENCKQIERLGKYNYLVSLKRGEYEWRWNNIKDDVEEMVKRGRYNEIRAILSKYSIFYLNYNPVLFKASWKA